MSSAIRKYEEPKQLDVERAKNYLAHCRDFDEVKKLRDQGEAVAVYLRSQKAADESVVHATNISHHASRRLGELVAEMPKQSGGHAAKARSLKGTEVKVPPTLADHGITKKQSSRWQAMASIPEAQFESTLADAVEAKKPVSAAALIRLAQRKEKAPPRKQRASGKSKSGRDRDEALMDLDADIRRHLESWEWPRAAFIAAIEGWTRRANAYFDDKEDNNVGK